MKLTLLASLLLAITIGPVAAQQRLTGKILDAATGQPVPYASISVLNTANGTTSNAEGEFELKAAWPGRLVVSELGHRRDTVAVAAATAPLLVRLQPAAVALPEVTTGSYTAELIKQAYLELKRTNAQKTYAQAFYRQVTKLDGDPTEVQEMVWHAKTSNHCVEGSAFAQGRFAKKKALISFTDFSLYTKAVNFFDAADSTSYKGIISRHAADNFNLKLLGVSQNGEQELVEIGFVNKNPNARNRRGSLVIDANTNQILRLRLEASSLHTKSNNPMFKFHDELTWVEWKFRPVPGSAAALEYVKIDYHTSMSRPLKSNMAIETSSFAYFYNGRATPEAGVAYAEPKAGVSDLAVIKKTTYDPAFWQNNPVVKRTPLEEQVMKSFEQKGAFGTMLTP